MKIFINLLVLQFSPTNPWVQSQEYEFKPSTHTPLFKQGVGWQLSMSEYIHKMSKQVIYTDRHLLNLMIYTYTHLFRSQAQ